MMMRHNMIKVVLLGMVLGAMCFGDEAPVVPHHHLLRRQVDPCNCKNLFEDPNISPDSLFDFPPKEMVLFRCLQRNVCKGFGDVLKGLVSTALMAVLTNHKLALQVEKPPIGNYYIFPSYFVDEWHHENPKVKKFRAFDHGRTGKYKGRVAAGTLFKPNYSYVARTNANYAYQIFNSPKFNKIMTEKFNASNPEVVFGCTLRFLFKPTLNLLALASEVLKDAGEEIVIGVHVRTGDGTSWSRTPVESIERFLGCYTSFLGDKLHKYHTYVASDKAEVFNIFRKHLPDPSKLITYPEVNGTIQGIGHSDQKCKGENRVEHCRLRRERTLIEHFVLSHVESLLVSNSGFSKTAAWMGGFYDPVMTKDFCSCVQGKTVEDFMEMKNGRMVPVFSRAKCSPLDGPAPSLLDEEEEEFPGEGEEGQEGHDEEDDEEEDKDDKEEEQEEEEEEEEQGKIQKLILEYKTKKSKKSK